MNPVKESVLAIINKRLNYLEENKDHLIVDGDTHPSPLAHLSEEALNLYKSTPNYYQGRPVTVEELLVEMKQAGVDMALSWQNPAVTVYGEDKDSNYESLLASNRYIFEAGQKYPQKILPAGWTDPKALGVDLALKIVDRCIFEFGFVIVKMNPAQNAYYIDSPEVMTVVDHIVASGGIPAFHFGGDSPYTPASGLETILKAHKDHPVIGVHMGGGGSHYVDGDRLYQDARELGLRYPNVFYILSAIRDTHIENSIITYQLAGEPFSNNIACGSDAPYGKQSWNFGGFKAMFSSLKDGINHPDPRVNRQPDLFTDEAIKKYMGENLIELVISGYHRLLEKQISTLGRSS